MAREKSASDLARCDRPYRSGYQWNFFVIKCRGVKLGFRGTNNAYRVGRQLL